MVSVASEDDDTTSSSHYYQPIDVAQFKQTILAQAAQNSFLRSVYPSMKRNQGGKGIMESTRQRSQPHVKFLTNEFRAVDSSTDETPPTTPSSCSSSSDGTITNQKKPKTVTLADDIRRESKFPRAAASNSSTEDEGWVSGNDQRIGTDNYWIGQRIAEKKINTNTPNLRQYWEQNSLRDQQEKQKQTQLVQNRSRRPFGFPKWRSNDAMTASLVASGKVPQLIPKDSQLPEHRKQKIEETERRAAVERQALQKSASSHKMQNMYKGKSMECLSMQVDYQPWYDRERIRSAISRESIGQIGAARDRFESGDFSDRDFRRGSSYALNNIDREPREQHSGVQSTVTSRPATSMAKPSYAPPDIPVQSAPLKAPSNGAQQINMSPEHYAFLQYMRQNPNILSDFGIEVPKNIINLSHNALDESKQNNASSRQIAPIQPVAPTPHRASGNGRYVKNGANGPRNHRRVYDVSVKQIPENKRQSMQDLDHQKAGDSLIAAEIRTIQEREDELRRSRSELGLPSLEDTLENWRSGRRISSAVSTDALNHNLSHGYSMPKSLVASCDDLQWEQQQPYYERHYDVNHAGYPINNFDEEDQRASLTATPSPTESSLPAISTPLTTTPTTLTIPSTHRTQQQHEQQHIVEHYEHSTLDVIDRMQRPHVSRIRRNFVSGGVSSSGTAAHLTDTRTVDARTQFEPTSIIVRATDQTEDHGRPTTTTTTTPTTTLPTSPCFKLFKSQDPDVMIYGPRRSGANSVVHVRESPITIDRHNQPRHLRYD